MFVTYFAPNTFLKFARSKQKMLCILKHGLLFKIQSWKTSAWRFITAPCGSSKSLVNAALAKAKFEIQLLTVNLGFLFLSKWSSLSSLYLTFIILERSSAPTVPLWQSTPCASLAPWPSRDQRWPKAVSAVSAVSGLLFWSNSFMVLDWDWPPLRPEGHRSHQNFRPGRLCYKSRMWKGSCYMQNFGE